MDILEHPDRDTDAERHVEFESEEAPLLPEQTADDTERGWGSYAVGNDERLMDDRPPHWD